MGTPQSSRSTLQFCKGRLGGSAASLRFPYSRTDGFHSAGFTVSILPDSRYPRTGIINQAAYQRQYESLSQRFHEAETRHKEITGQISDIVTRRGTMESCLSVLRKQKGELTEFCEDLWCRLLDYATIYHDGRMTFTFKTGQTFDG